MLQVSYSVKDYPNAEYPCSIVYRDSTMHDGPAVRHEQVCVCYWHMGTDRGEQVGKNEARKIASMYNEELSKSFA